MEKVWKIKDHQVMKGKGNEKWFHGKKAKNNHEIDLKTSQKLT